MKSQDFIHPDLIDETVNSVFAQEQKYYQDLQIALEWFKEHFFIKKFIHNARGYSNEFFNKEDYILCFTYNNKTYARYSLDLHEISTCISLIESMIDITIEGHNNKTGFVIKHITKSIVFPKPDHLFFEPIKFKPIKIILDDYTFDDEYNAITFEKEFNIESVKYIADGSKITLKETNPIIWLGKNS